MGAAYHTPQDTTDGSGRHAHNGEILQYLQPAAPTGSRLIHAYHAYAKHTEPKNIQHELASAYNNPLPATADHAQLVALQRFVDQHNSAWIRHGIELPERADYSSNTVYPDPSTRHDIGEQVQGKNRSLNRYAVDLERWPFVTCSNHRLDRETHAPWYSIAGYISVQDFAKLLGEIHHSEDRDHLYCSSNIPTHAWTFVIRTPDPRNPQRRALLQNIETIRTANIPYLMQQQLTDLTALVTHLQNHAAVMTMLKPDSAKRVR